MIFLSNIEMLVSTRLTLETKIPRMCRWETPLTDCRAVLTESCFCHPCSSKTPRERPERNLKGLVLTSWWSWFEEVENQWREPSCLNPAEQSCSSADTLKCRAPQCSWTSREHPAHPGSWEGVTPVLLSLSRCLTLRALAQVRVTSAKVVYCPDEKRNPK